MTRLVPADAFATLFGSFHVKKIPPSPALAPFVRTFEVVETRDGMTRTLLPETGLIIGFRYSGSATLHEGASARVLPSAVVTGLRRSARRMQTSPGGGMILAKFREGRAARFFGHPLHELFGESRPLDELVRPGEVARASDRIAEARTLEERIALLEQFLRALWRPGEPDRLVLRAGGAIDGDPASVRIGALARHFRISQDALENRFRRAVGAPPKQLASLVRFRRAMALLRSGVSLTQLGFEAGYSDQSHFIRECRRVTGEPPGRFLDSARDCC